MASRASQTSNGGSCSTVGSSGLVGENHREVQLIGAHVLCYAYAICMPCIALICSRVGKAYVTSNYLVNMRVQRGSWPREN